MYEVIIASKPFNKWASSYVHSYVGALYVCDIDVSSLMSHLFLPYAEQDYG